MKHIQQPSSPIKIMIENETPSMHYSLLFVWSMDWTTRPLHTTETAASHEPMPRNKCPADFSNLALSLPLALCLRTVPPSETLEISEHASFLPFVLEYNFFFNFLCNFIFNFLGGIRSSILPRTEAKLGPGLLLRLYHFGGLYVAACMQLISASLVPCLRLLMSGSQLTSM